MICRQQPGPTIAANRRAVINAVESARSFEHHESPYLHSCSINVLVCPNLRALCKCSAAHSRLWSASALCQGFCHAVAIPGASIAPVRNSWFRTRQQKASIASRVLPFLFNLATYTDKYHVFEDHMWIAAPSPMPLRQRLSPPVTKDPAPTR